MFIEKIFITVIFLFCSNLAFGLQANKINKFDGVVWGFDFKSENEMYVTLRSGKLFHYNLKTKVKKELVVPEVYAGGQAGLLDVKYYRSFLYITYSEKAKAGATTVLARAEVKKNSLGPWQKLFVAKVKTGSNVHFGSRIAFSGDVLFMTVGDRGKRDQAQDLNYHNGKILRLTLAGKPVAGNPFIGKTGLDEIWSYGHRNPQGIVFAGKKLYSIEFGPRGGDELNLVLKGKNYGWPKVTYGKEYWGPSIGKKSLPGMEPPVTHWTPSISPSGLAYVAPSLLKQWSEPSFLLACLGAQQLRRVVMSEGKVKSQQVLFKELNERVRHVSIGPDKKIYFSTDSGFVYKVKD